MEEKIIESMKKMYTDFGDEVRFKSMSTLLKYLDLKGTDSQELALVMRKMRNQGKIIEVDIKALSPCFLLPEWNIRETDSNLEEISVNTVFGPVTYPIDFAQSQNLLNGQFVPNERFASLMNKYTFYKAEKSKS